MFSFVCMDDNECANNKFCGFDKKKVQDKSGLLSFRGFLLSVSLRYTVRPR